MDFNWHFKGGEDDAHHVLRQVCQVMGVDANRLHLVFYSEPGQIEFSEGLISQQGHYLSTAGKYVEFENGLIEIMIEEKQLKNPTSLIATIAHELMHVRLLGDRMIEENDEYLTDLGALVYGFGVFVANAAVVKMNTWSGISHTGWQVSGGAGYLHYKVQAFALALLANYKGEQEPEWIDFLEEDVKKTYRQSRKYIEVNFESIRFK
ncbi:hypothetical protein C900_01519 [Fulvivirga imtechensis AK7]|uniref:Uncharacterized protein n=1 Tax=Fulvivirga imtechensis AK7 TaxID=1237149 RepID=L8JTV9_9BACT|nr:hypothetical protein [Fulvivirga imtechensis]ELR72436.1 hypothetical protein C900_01519 [Fulvivirga imtechensis AK7]